MWHVLIYVIDVVNRAMLYDIIKQTHDLIVLGDMFYCKKILQ